MSEDQDELRKKRLARLQSPTASQSLPITPTVGSSAMEVSEPVMQSLPVIPEVKSMSAPVEIFSKPASVSKEDPLESTFLTLAYIYEVDHLYLKSAVPNPNANHEIFAMQLCQLAFFKWMSSTFLTASRLSEEFLEICKNCQKDAEMLYYIACCYSRCQEAKFSNELIRKVVSTNILNCAILLVNGGLTSVTFNCTAFYYLFKEKFINGEVLLVILTNANDQKIVDRICHSILKQLSINVVETSLANQSFRQPVEILAELCSLKVASGNWRPFCSSMVRLENWLPQPFTKDHAEDLKAAHGRELQVLSYLGPFFGLSTFAEDDSLILFDCYGVDEPSHAQLNMSNAGLSQNAENLRRYLHEIVHLLLINPESRVPTLNYIVAVLERSWRRRQHYFDYRVVATDGFVLNWLYVLQKLCVKIKTDRVSKNYLWHSKCRIARLLQNDDARIHFNKQQLEDWLAVRPKSAEDDVEPSFSTECFFMTAFIHHIGIVSVIRRFTNRSRALYEIKEMKAKLEKKVEEGGTLTKEETRQLKLVKLELSAVKRMGLSIGGSLGDPCLIDQTIQFLNTFCSFLLSYIFPDPKNIPTQFGATNVSDLPEAFRALPEFFFENISEWLFYYARVHPVELSQSLVDDIITWFTLFLSNTSLIKNPFLTARLVETLFMLCPQGQHYPTERLFTTIVMSPIALAALVPSLMKFYVDCELTGSHTEFFDKFNIRYHISVIFRQIWNSLEYKAAIIREAQTACTVGASSTFVKFVNMLINDCTFFLDESMQLLKRIHEIQELQANETEWNKLSEDQKKAKSEVLAQDERSVPSYLNLGDDNLRMFSYLTKDCPEAFLVPEIVDKLAAMLNYNLAQLCGPRCIELKVRNPEKFRWDPKQLLQRLIEVYLHFDCDRFAAAVAGDERSYDDDLFPRACNRLLKTGILPSSDVELFQQLGQRVAVHRKERMQEEVDLGEPPDHFKDALMDSLMNDPVRLPSGKVVDRQVASRLILDRHGDPFSRQELSEQILVPLPELKQEIQEWIKARKADLRQSRS